MGDNVSWLTSCPASDLNFKNRLLCASDEQIAEAVHIMSGRAHKGDSQRLNAIARETKRRNRLNEKKER